MTGYTTPQRKKKGTRPRTPGTPRKKGSKQTKKGPRDRNADAYYGTGFSYRRQHLPFARSYLSFQRKNLVVPRDYPTRCLGLIKYPHGSTTLKPKVPDGSVVQSLGRSFRTRCGRTISTNDCFIWLVPGLSHVMQVNDFSGDLTLASDNFLNTVHGSWTSTKPATERIFAQDDIDKWRIVSQAMRITCTSDANDNGGHYEVRRYPVEVFSDMLVQYRREGNSYERTDGVVLDCNELIPSDLFSSPFSKTYGQLKNISKRYFELPLNSTQSHFVDIQQETACVGVDVTLGNTKYTQVNTSGATTDIHDFLQSNFSGYHDLILVRIKGAEGAHITIDVVQNQEFVLQEDSVLKPYETPGCGVHQSLAHELKKLRERCRYDI